LRVLPAPLLQPPAIYRGALSFACGPVSPGRGTDDHRELIARTPVRGRDD